MGAVLQFERHKPGSESVKYVIAYDICEPRRLRRVAKCLERSAVRVQKSVFICDGSRQELEGRSSRRKYTPRLVPPATTSGRGKRLPARIWTGWQTSSGVRPTLAT